MGVGNGFTLEAWIDCTNVVQLNPIFEWNKADGKTYWGVHFYVGPAGSGSLFADIVDTGGTWHYFSSPNGVVASNVFQHVALTYDKATGTATMYCNGAIVARSTLGTFTPQTTYSLYLGKRPGPDALYSFAGLLDEPSIYNRALSSNEIVAIYNAGSGGKCAPSPGPPLIASQPVNQTAAVGGAATFAVAASGTPPLAYQWNFDGTNISGATNVSLTLANVQLTNAGNYAVTVTNAFGSTISSNATLLVGFAPGITTQPASQTNLVGTTATFAVVAGGSTPLSYQWSKNGANITGATSTNFTVLNVQTNDAGTYSVAITNAFGSIISSNAMLTVLSPPVIIVQPTNQSVVVNNSATFTVVASGTLPLSYQWSFNSTNLVGATNASLTLANVQLTQSGNYSVLVTNIYGSAQSSNALLTVNSSSCDPEPSGLVSWWPAEGNANDIIGTNNGVLEGGLGFAPGEVGQAFFFNNTNNDVKVPASSSLNVGAGNGFTLEAWIDCTNVAQLNPIFEWNKADGTTYWGVHFYVGPTGPGSLFADIVDSGGTWHYFYSPNGVVASNVFQHVALTYDKATGTATMYCNGAIVARSTLGTFTPQTTYSLYLGKRPGPDALYSFAGLLDEPSIYNRALSSNEIAAIYNAGSAGKCPAPPIILAQPTNQTVMAGATATFSVKVNGSAPFFYQWSFSGMNLPGATNASLTLTNVQFAQAGAYSVLVANAAGSTNSANATLTVNAAPSITAQPANSTNVVGTTAAFTVAACGSAPLNYQWKKNGTNLIGVTGTNFTIVNVQTNDAGTYSVAITNAFGSVISSNAMLTVLVPPSITLQPASSTNLAGTTATFTNAASGTLPLSYQWQKNGANLNDSGNVSGSAATTLTLAGVSDADAASYTVVVTNIAGSVTSSPAILVLLDPPAILSQPTNLTVTVTSNAAFSVIATGSPVLSYQWNFNGTNILGETNASLTLTNVQLNQAGIYTVWVTNNYGSILSSNATLVVNPLLYFVWNQITSPRFVNTPFDVVIQAQNLTNGIVTNFTDAVLLL